MTHFSDGVRVGRAFTTLAAPGAQTSPIYVYDIVPAAISTTSIAAAQAVAAAGFLTLTTTTLDFPRAVQIVSSTTDTTQTALVTGKDVYGQPMSESIAFNGTTPVFGKKAFSTISSIYVTPLLAGNASVGTSDILGLPYAVNSRNYVQTAVNGTFVTTGTLTAAVTTSPATTTTGDVRGTFLPATATDGSKRYTMYIFVKDPDTQTGLYGVTQA
jgi:hypothetical protein